MIASFLSYDEMKKLVDAAIAKGVKSGPGIPGGDTTKGAALKKSGT